MYYSVKYQLVLDQFNSYHYRDSSANLDLYFSWVKWEYNGTMKIWRDTQVGSRLEYQNYPQQTGNKQHFIS